VHSLTGIIIAAGAGLAACQQIKNGSLDALLFEEGFFSRYLTEAIIAP